MQAKLNIVLKLANELGLTAIPDSPFSFIETLAETDRLRLGVEKLFDEYGINEELCDQHIQSLNEIKKKRFELKILSGGTSISSLMELKDLKGRGVSSLIDIPIEVRQQVSALESQILLEQENLRTERKKSKETIVEENNLLPNLNFRVGVSFVLTLFASIFVVLGFIASTDERFYDKDFGYWSMLLGGLACLITVNILVIRIIQAIRFQMNKSKAINDLAFKFISKLETEFENNESTLRQRIFGLESAVYAIACKNKLVEHRHDIKKLLSGLLDHFR
ncbi:MAG: hypothetical protein P8M50_08395 [Paracoccaceae bacterium]|nr:hypothetical protein [Paracoccaceae bacterium]